MMMMMKNIRPSQIRCLNSIRFKSSLPEKLATTPNKYNSKSSAFNLKPNLPEGLFFHPSPSSPNPEITPKAFLPGSDPRKTSELYYPEQDTNITSNVQYMPILSKSRSPKNYQLTKNDVEELQKMRDAGASRKEMKAKFNTTDHFINISTVSNPVTVQKEIENLNITAKNWSKKTRLARELKEKHKLLWERDL